MAVEFVYRGYFVSSRRFCTVSARTIMPLEGIGFQPCHENSINLGFSPAALLVSLVERPLETYNRSESV